MSGTIETTNNLILIKIKSLTDIGNIVNKLKTNPTLDIRVNNFITQLQEISNDYEMGSAKILTDYFLLIQKFKNEDKNEYNIHLDKYFDKYQIFIKKENFVGRIDRHCITLKNIVNSIISTNPDIKSHISRIKALFVNYENSTIIRNTSNVVYNKCNICNREMKIIANLSEIVCTHCGITENLYGTVFEDEQFYYQEGQRSKHGSYDPSKHCRFWIERIQARESKDIPDSVIEAVRNCIRRNNIRNKEDITCKEIRKYLSQTRNSGYNEHIPLIRKMIIGISPPQLTDQELQLITIYFDKVIRIYEEIKPNDKINVPYHPYLIYKIIEHILQKKAKNTKKRINEILSCVHLQSRETLIENDKTWKHICDYIDEIEYKPTDRNDQHD
jgi:hypothetical protein